MQEASFLAACASRGADGKYLSSSQSTLVVAPMALGSFDTDFLDLKERLEDTLGDDEALGGRVQLVTFHPRYRFQDGLNAEGPDVMDVDEAFLRGAGIKGMLPEQLQEIIKADLAEDPADYTNRAPFPIFQLLRTAEVSEAIASRGGDENMSAIWERNVEHLREKGAKEMRDLLASCINDQN
mmetsp:Transcript_17970/g.68130  ORF Transcript_17970/g.68130 Transcript_17970/m.68130 type:complete len:182 (-) Transcript_17970:153-698(-)